MAVGAEVVLVAPVVGDDVARAGLVGADDLEVVLLRLRVADPRLHRGPAAARHLVAGLLERARHEARAPRVAGADAGGREVLVDLRAGVDAVLVDAELGLREASVRTRRACSSRSPAPPRRRRRPCPAPTPRRRTALGGPGGRLDGQERAGAALLRVHHALGRGHELAGVAGLGLRRERGGGGRRRARSGRGRGGGDRRGRRGRAGLAEQPVGLAEAQAVAAAVLLGRALDVRDPVAELVRVGDGLAGGDPLLLDRLGLVEEPLDLELGLLREARVRRPCSRSPRASGRSRRSRRRRSGGSSRPTRRARP